MISRQITDLIKEHVADIPVQHEISFIQDPKFGDYSSNIAFLLAKIENRAATDIANELKDKLSKYPIFSNVSVAGRGFINFTLARDFLISQISAADQNDFGKVNIGNQEKILVEYISANPTGPLNVVQARAGAFGNALVNLLRYVNYDAVSEYYINNTGTQIEMLYESLLARINEFNDKPSLIPENGYHGLYLKELARQILDNKIPQDQWQNYLLETIIARQKDTINKFGLHFDNFVRESTFIPRREQVLEKLKSYTYRKDGALWFKSTDFKDSEDRVIITANGRPTYILSDLAYHWDKFDRGFTTLINIWGPDHHGYIARMHGGIKVLGFNPERLIVIIAQQVTLLRNKEKIVMSKRAGEFITLEEVMNEIGPDALKFFLLMRRPSQHLEFDLALAQKTSQENPVYYVQYAYARINSIIKNALEKNLSESTKPDLTILESDTEQALIKMIIHFPDLIAASAKHFEPHHLIYYLIQLATAFHAFYEKVRVITDDATETQARLYLCQCTQKVIQNALSILGVSAPEKM
ncbi:MAG: arginine--tRNA ligase [Candidatus Latescibacteria bacterium]|nr:arginine--tRNA ligase [Candidatus Latescibacterota bacterium]